VEKKQVSAIAAVGVVVTVAAIGAALLSSSAAETPTRDTVPVGQLVEVPTSSAPTSSAEPQAVVVDPNPKDTAVNAPAQQPAPQTVQAPAPAVNDDPVPPTTEPVPPSTNPAGEVTAPPPAPTVRCRMDDSDPVNYPNGRQICETITPAP
jgi:hypothetical protein